MNYQRLNYPNGYKKVVQPKKQCPMQTPNIPKPIPPMGPIPPMEPLPPMEPGIPMPLPTPIPNNQNNVAPVLNLFPVDEAFVNGTIYRGLFKPYKNYRPIRPELNTERDRMLFDVNKYHFAMVELNFYLNNFPNDQEALRIFNEFRDNYLRAKTAFESRFGALDITSSQLERGPWNWVQTNAPWKRGV